MGLFARNRPIPANTRLAQIAARFAIAGDVGSKPDYLWDAYEPYLAPLARSPISLLEIGVHKGVSIKTFSRFLTKGTVVGVDVTLPDVGWTDFPNATVMLGDQRDATRLGVICDEHAPRGFDFIIDDASHIGEWSMHTYRALFPRLKIGGLYFIEDWGAAYIPGRGDGAPAEPTRLVDRIDGYAKRITSHDFGMAGFVKSLIDEFASNAQPFEWMHIQSALVVIKKRC